MVPTGAFYRVSYRNDRQPIEDLKKNNDALCAAMVVWVRQKMLTLACRWKSKAKTSRKSA